MTRDSFTTGDLTYGSGVKAYWHDLVRERKLTLVERKQWATTGKLDPRKLPGTLVFADARASEAAFELDGLVATVSVGASGDVTLQVAMDPARSEEETAFLYAKVMTLLPADRAEDGDRVRFSFWTNSPNGPSRVSRKIDTHRWEDVAGNYSANGTRGALAQLMAEGFRPDHGGQLILWHGPPGTGKTHALQTLSYEWRRWCKFEYIVDPEQFFGADAHYMVRVLLDSTDYDDEDEEEAARASGWRCFVLEDTGELLSADAKERSGQGLSRLLNVTDGIIGQGLKVLVLVTTNEPFGRLHQAVARPGRSAAQIDFTTLTEREAREWLTRRGDPAREPTVPQTLAHLFARLAGRAEAEETPPVGQYL